MKTLFQYYPFDMKISNNIFFGPILMELHYLFMNGHAPMNSIFEYFAIFDELCLRYAHLFQKTKHLMKT